MRSTPPSNDSTGRPKNLVSATTDARSHSSASTSSPGRAPATSPGSGRFSVVLRRRATRRDCQTRQTRHLARAIVSHDFDRLDEPVPIFRHPHLFRFWYAMISALELEVEGVAPRVVGDAEEVSSLGFELVAQIRR